MILDRGVCEIYTRESVTVAGGKPQSTLTQIFIGYYAELNFETAPARPTEKREETRTAARIRILQCRSIRDGDVCHLEPFDGQTAKTEKYRIVRAWHGADEENGGAITDLTLEVDEK